MTVAFDGARLSGESKPKRSAVTLCDLEKKQRIFDGVCFYVIQTNFRFHSNKT